MLIQTYVSGVATQIRSYRLRSFLTILGVIIANCAIVLIVSLGNSVQAVLSNQIEDLGANIVNLAMVQTDTHNLRLQDIERLKESPLLPEIIGVHAPYSSSTVVEYGNHSYNSIGVTGSQADMFKIVNYLRIEQGRAFTNIDNRLARRVVVINPTLATNLFSSPDSAIGKIITIEHEPFTVIGVLGSSQTLTDENIYIPIESLYTYIVPTSERNRVDYAEIKVDPNTDLASFRERLLPIIEDITGLHNSHDTFVIVTFEEQIKLVQSIILGFQIFLATVAGVSLLVGGINMMNIILVTVYERTPEIGLRKAIGARSSTILFQFIFEAIILTIIGCIIGIALSALVAYIMIVLANTLQSVIVFSFEFSILGAVIAIIASICMAILAAAYPAWKAARLSPSVALHTQ